METLKRLEQGVRVFGDPKRRVERTGNTVHIDGHALKLPPQSATILELALREGGLPFEEAQIVLKVPTATASEISARVQKLKDALGKAPNKIPFRILVTTKGKRITAVVQPK